jgi:hypothetical protein
MDFVQDGVREMPVYLLAYHGSRIPKTEAENAELMTAWLDWMDQLGDALEANNNPITATRTIHPDGAVSDDGGANPVVGLSFITADTIEAAIQMAKTCPHLAAGGSIEVAQLFTVNRDRSRG